MVDFNGLASPDDLLILLSVARLGRFNTVADALGTTHTTISRRIAALDKQLGDRTLARTQHGWELTALGAQAIRAAEAIEKSLGTLAADARQDSDPLSGLLRISTVDGFGAEIAAPALIRLQADHAQLKVELLSATRKISQNRSGVDLEIVIGRPEVHNAQAMFLTDYYLRLYASPGYLERKGTPTSIAALRHHTFISYVESALLVAELGLASAQFPEPASSFTATSIFAQLQAVRQHGGIGLLPSFLAHGDPGLAQVLPDSFERRLSIWMVARPESLRSSAIQAAIDALRTEVADRQEALLGRPRAHRKLP
jgi:DNA-binding transcriptional LysR family regulator